MKPPHPDSDSGTDADELPNESEAELTVRIDRIGSALVIVTAVAGLLLVFQLTPALGYYWKSIVEEVKHHGQGYSELRFMILVMTGLDRLYLWRILALVICGLSFWLLITISDRKRANLYAGIAGCVLIALGLLVALVFWLPVLVMFSGYSEF